MAPEVGAGVFSHRKRNQLSWAKSCRCQQKYTRRRRRTAVPEKKNNHPKTKKTHPNFYLKWRNFLLPISAREVGCRGTLQNPWPREATVPRVRDLAQQPVFVPAGLAEVGGLVSAAAGFGGDAGGVFALEYPLLGGGTPSHPVCFGGVWGWGWWHGCWFPQGIYNHVVAHVLPPPTSPPLPQPWGAA